MPAFVLQGDTGWMDLPDYIIYQSDGYLEGEGDDEKKEGDGGDDQEGADDDLKLEGDFDAERAKKTILDQRKAEKELKDQLKAMRKTIKDLEALKQAADDKDKSELEKAQSRVADLESKLTAAEAASQTYLMQIEFRAEVEKQGLSFVSAVAAKDAFKLLDTKGIKIEDGEVTGLDSAIKELAKNRPYLFGTEDDAIGTTRRSRDGKNGKLKIETGSFVKSL